MLISKIGHNHKSFEVNCQDSYYQGKKVKLITDGCSNCKNSEVGAKLFTQLFSMLPAKDNPREFENNIDIIMRRMLMLANIDLKEEITVEQVRFMNDNYSFSIIAMFETEEDFIVKIFGNGVIITRNILGEISYIEIEQNDQPSYAIYQYMPKEYMEESLEFDCTPRTYIFNKKNFRDVGISSEGIKGRQNLDKEQRTKFDLAIMNNGVSKAKSIINTNYICFVDDITLILHSFEEVI